MNREEIIKEFEDGDCQNCGEPLNNGGELGKDGDLCFQCQVAKTNP